MGDHEVFDPPEWGQKMQRCCLLPQRIVLAIFGFTCVICCYLPRVGLSHAITVMVTKKNKTVDQSSIICPEDTHGSDKIPSKGEFDWSEREQGYLLSAFFIGYVLSHVPAGYISDKYGAKWVLVTGLTGSMIVSFLSPPSAYVTGAYGFIGLRVVLGLCQGVLFPGLSSWLANWIPPNERGRIGGLVLGANILGSIASNACSGFLIQHFDWPILFYVYGIITGIWVITAIPLSQSYPVDHKCIKEKEIEYIRAELGHIGPMKKPPTPWKKILTNCPVWAMIIGHAGHDWGLYVMVVDLPKYMSNVLNMQPAKNGLVTALPFIFMWIVLLISAFVGDELIKRNIITLNHYRKLSTNIAAVLPATFMVLASYAGCNHTVVVAMFSLSLGSMGTYYTGIKLTPMDMSPNNAGVLMAITNGFGAVAGFVAPIVVGYMTPNATLLEWRIVFWLSFFLLIASSIVFSIWGKSELQAFDSEKDDK